MMLRRVLAFSVVTATCAVAQPLISPGSNLHFLRLSPSIRSTGMGMTGVAAGLVDVSHFNPANLAWPTAQYVQISFSPTFAELYGSPELKYRSEDIAFTLPWLESTSLSGSIGYTHNAFRVNSLYWWDHETPLGEHYEDHYWSSVSDEFALGLGWDGVVKVGVGFGLKWVKELYPEFEGSGTAIDQGFILRLPIVAPSKPEGASVARGFSADFTLGVSLLNNSGSVMMGRWHSARFHKTGRYGITMELSYANDRRAWLRLLPAFEKEIQDYSPDSTRTHLGVDLVLGEMVHLRAGRVILGPEYPSSTIDFTTYGLEFSTTGIRSRSVSEDPKTNTGLFNYLLNNLEIQLLYAHVGPEFDGWDGTNFYGIELLF